jgi:phenylalanyl-tRNA synthetase beta chain
VEADLPHERPVLCAVLGGQQLTRWSRPADAHVDFFDAKGAVESILRAEGVVDSYKASEEYGLLTGHTAQVLSGKRAVGIVGQVHPDTAAAFDIAEPVFLLELWLEELAQVLPERPDYTPPSRFPEIREDLALLIDEEMPAGRALELIRAHRSGSIRLRAEVFDEYRGAGVPEGKKSLAIGVRYAAADKTLTDEDVAKVKNGLLRRLEKELGATLRGA